MIETVRDLMVDILRCETIGFGLSDHNNIDYAVDGCKYLKLLAVQVRYEYVYIESAVNLLWHELSIRDTHHSIKRRCGRYL